MPNNGHTLLLFAATFLHTSARSPYEHGVLLTMENDASLDERLLLERENAAYEIRESHMSRMRSCR
jgi:hypothetical protein